MIKGVAGYADGCGGKEWQFTAALAALNYTKSKLFYYQGQDRVSSECRDSVCVCSSKYMQVQVGLSTGFISGGGMRPIFSN